MGKNHSIYLNEQSDELIGSLDGKGTLINELIIEHFANDEETLRRKVAEKEQEFNALVAKLNLVVENRNRAEAKSQEVKKKSEAEIALNERVEAWKLKLENKEITVDEYFDAFDKGEFNK